MPWPVHACSGSVATEILESLRPAPGRLTLSRASLVRLGALVLVVGLTLFVLSYYVDVDRDDIADFIERAGIWGPITYAVILILGLTIPFNPVSDLLTVTAAAIVFDPLEAIAATFAAQFVAVSVNYSVGRVVGMPLVQRLERQERAGMFFRLSDRLDLKALFVLRFALPLVAIGGDWLSYLAGTKRLNFPGFVVVSLVPWTLMSVLYFTSASALREISPLLVFLPAVVIVVGASAIVVLLRRGRVIDA